MVATAPSLEKMNDTVQKLREIVGRMDTCSQSELNQYEDKIRNEFQVIEAMIAYVGRDIYEIAQKRRMALRGQNIAEIQQLTDNFKKEVSNGDSGTNGSLGGTNGLSGSKLESDSKTKRPSRQSKSKK